MFDLTPMKISGVTVEKDFRMVTAFDNQHFNADGNIFCIPSYFTSPFLLIS